MFARLLLFHLPQRVAVLGRLWEAVRPGGHLVVQDYDLGSADVLPPSAGATEAVRLIVTTFEALGCDVRTGLRLPLLFAEAGVGAPDDTDVAGRMEPLATGLGMLEHTLRSVLPAAYGHGITSERHAKDTLAALRRDAAGRVLLWPLMTGAWRRKPA